MQEALDRHELPIQSINERNHACTATVPVHLKVLRLPPKIRCDLTHLQGSREVVRDWYNADMKHHLHCLVNYGPVPGLKGYDRFNEDWTLDAVPDEQGFLRLQWQEEKQVHKMQFVVIHTILYNQFNENREFYTPEYFKGKDELEIMYRSLHDEETVYLTPEKMKCYGSESGSIRIARERGVARVLGQSFCSEYHMSMPRALLLRNYAVFYLNRLLEVAK
tara:strand:+ start:751 stop:1410 length:660 start_codon:yes stop_codon:yes gene_type:complete